MCNLRYADQCGDATAYSMVRDASACRLNKTTKRCENAHFGVRTTPRLWDNYQFRQNTAIVNIDVDALIPGGSGPVRGSVGIQSFLCSTIESRRVVYGRLLVVEH